MLGGLGHKVTLTASEAVRPLVKRGTKNDVADAAAICAAACRPDARFVAVRSAAQQGVLALHSARTLLVEQQAMLANAMRSLATEFGIVVSKGLGKLEELRTLVEADAGCPEQARAAFAELMGPHRAATERIRSLETKTASHAAGRRSAALGHGPQDRTDHRFAE